MRVGGGRLITRQTWRFIFMGLFIALWTVLSLASQTEPSARVLRLCKQGNLPHSLGLYIGLTTSIAVPSKPLIALRRGNKAKQNGPIYFPKEHGASTCHPQTFRPLKKCNLVEKLKDTAELATVPKYLLSNFCRKKRRSGGGIEVFGHIKRMSFLMIVFFFWKGFISLNTCIF